MSLYIVLLLASSALAAGQCSDTQQPDMACEGDGYKVIKDRLSSDECCADCAADARCVQWTFKPGFIFSSVCTLSSVNSEPAASSGSTCAVHKAPAPTPAPGPPAPTPAPAPGAHNHWAVIMAGSNTYGNYRHQADACHAYQIAKKNGIPESNIIMLAYDDIADSSENPFKGKIFNKPNGPDVYAGCNIDYKGKDVNKATFLNVLTGTGTGKVLKSTATSKVFVYFADHGGVGILGVPDGAAGGYIHAKEVNTALDTMHTKKMYSELVFYVEACESGSIFTGLLTAPNVVAVTAANAKESSWGTYCPPNDVVNGKQLNSCLGDLFSVSWMEDSDVASAMTSETITQQIAKVTKETNKSHVQVFGSKSDVSTIGKEVIGAFQGGRVAGSMASQWASVASTEPREGNVDSRDVAVHLAYSKMERAETMAQKRGAQADLAALLAGRVAVDVKFTRIATLAMDGDEAKAQSLINGDLERLDDAACHMKAMKIVADSCGPFGDYSMRYSRLFANLCSIESLPFDKIDSAVTEVCTSKSEIVI